jgi:hypothetical protein
MPPQITRNLWNSLYLLLNHHNLPWCFIWDFNAIIGAHEYRGRFNPARSRMEDFQTWSDSYNLIHLNTRCSEFTWSNGRDGNSLTERRLDRVICNQALIDCCSSLSATTLVKHRSNHFPLFLELHNSLETFASQFKFFRMWTLHPDCKSIVQDVWNILVIDCPMFILNKKLRNIKERPRVWNKVWQCA